LYASVTILPDFSDYHALSSGNPSWLVFHVSISFCSQSSLASEFDWPRKRPLDPQALAWLGRRNRNAPPSSTKTNAPAASKSNARRTVRRGGPSSDDAWSQYWQLHRRTEFRL